MSIFSHLCIAVLFSIAAVAAMSPASAITLAKDGETEYVIVIAADAIPAEKTAARELAGTLKQVTGAEFAVVSERQAAPGTRQILVGPSNRARSVAPDVNWGSLAADETVVRTAGNTLIMAGGRPRGTLYAVYTFLEDTAGCRWWTPTESTIPNKPTLSVPPLNIRHAPKFVSREAFYRFPIEDPIFASRLKLNGHFSPITEEYGGHMGFIGFVHTFYAWVPPDKHFAAHPEWFSLINGKRTTQHAQLCLTNPELLKEMTRVVLEKIGENPSLGLISVSQNDCHNPCQCDKCRALAEAEGSEAGPLIAFVNAVAEEVEKKYPNVLVETLAYQYTRKPPKTLKPRKNVVVRLCSIECDFSQPLNSDPNATFRDDILGWKAIAPNLFIWNYVTDFAAYIQPHPNMAALAPDLRFFADSNVIGVFEQGDCFTTVGDFVRLRNWVIAHLLWDPSRDQNALVREFAAGYYGPAAKQMLSYLRLVENAWMRKPGRLSCYNTDLTFLTIHDMTEAARLFDEAARAVKGQPALEERIRRERLPLDHVWLLRYEDLKHAAKDSGIAFAGPSDPRAACEEFIALCEKWDARHATEGLPFAPYAAQLRGRFRGPAPSVEELSALPKADVIELQQDAFHLPGQADWAAIVDDPGASDGKAARMPANHAQWAVQLAITEELAKAARGEWAIYLVVRCDATAGDGNAFDFGVFNDKAKTEVIRGTAAIGRMRGPEYKVLDAGAHKLRAGMYVWVAPRANASEVQAVYVDRIVLVRQK